MLTVIIVAIIIPAIITVAYHVDVATGSSEPRGTKGRTQTFNAWCYQRRWKHMSRLEDCWARCDGCNLRDQQQY